MSQGLTLYVLNLQDHIAKLIVPVTMYDPTMIFAHVTKKTEVPALTH